MSDRRGQIERAYDRESAAIEKSYERGNLSNTEYNDAMRQLERDAQHEARDAYEQDIEDVRDGWRW